MNPPGLSVYHLVGIRLLEIHPDEVPAMTVLDTMAKSMCVASLSLSFCILRNIDQLTNHHILLSLVDLTSGLVVETRDLAKQRVGTAAMILSSSSWKDSTYILGVPSMGFLVVTPSSSFELRTPNFLPLTPPVAAVCASRGVVVGAASDQTIQVWKMDTGAPLQTLRAPLSRSSVQITSLDVSS